MSRRGIVIVVVLLLLALLGLASGPAWGAGIARLRTPEPGHAHEAETQVADAAAADLLASPGTKAADCTTRVLRTAGETTWALVRCRWLHGEEHVEGGLAGPVRVDGDRVTWPQDGGEYADSIRRDYPWDVAALVLSRPDDLMPPEPASPGVAGN